MGRRLVILTTHFGTKFSGGSTATCEIFSRLENHFDEVVVLGTQLGEHLFSKLDFRKFGTSSELKRLIREVDSSETIYYGDFYNAVAFAEAQVPFYFTYHDNWPELANTSFSNWLDGFSYIRAYEKIFKSAKHVFTVSQFKQDQISQYSSNTSLVRNGFRQANRSTVPTQTSRRNILMVGNIDQRKYEKALVLFEQWQPKCEVHIYGRSIDHQIAERLRNLPFVDIKGFVTRVPYQEYRMLLHTSLMENLPITFCEAIDAETPVVAFDVGGSNEVVDQDSGLLVSPYDLDQMEKSIEAAYNSYDNFNFDSSKLDGFSWDKAAEQYQRVLFR